MIKTKWLALSVTLVIVAGCGGGGGNDSLTPTFKTTCPNGQVAEATTEEGLKVACPPTLLVKSTPIHDSVIAADSISAIIVETDSTLSPKSILPDNIKLKAGVSDLGGVVEPVGTMGFKFTPFLGFLSSQSYSLTVNIKDSMDRDFMLTLRFATETDARCTAPEVWLSSTRTCVIF